MWLTILNDKEIKYDYCYSRPGYSNGCLGN